MTEQRLPLFGVRKYARELQTKCRLLSEKLDQLGGLSFLELEVARKKLEDDIDTLRRKYSNTQAQLSEQESIALQSLRDIQKQVVKTEELALLQESGIYEYQHPLADAVAYKERLTEIKDKIKAMVKADEAIRSPTGWTVNGSEAQGRKMIKETSKLMLRAFNAEADGQVVSLKPYKLDASVDRLKKTDAIICKLGKTMGIHISASYLALRIKELELTADFLHKQAEEKEAEREERARIREERQAQQEMERERAKLEKEQKHYENALQALIDKGDNEAAERMRLQLEDVQRAIEDVDYRAANIRAGYVYVISNIGSFGESMVKVGMTRRLDPMDRVRELSDASVPFNFDVHAIFFSKDAIGIEQSMHDRMADKRVNRVNLRREFFYATPEEAKGHLKELAGELLQFHDIPEAPEYRESANARRTSVDSLSAGALL